jgi:ubiquitin-protein ligase
MSDAGRLAAERRYLRNNPIDGVIITWPNNSLDKLVAEITAPDDSIYRGDIFTVEFTLTGYPRSSPRVQMKTPIVHPNIDAHGAVCVAALRTQWASTVKLHAIILEIIHALQHPNPYDELNIANGLLMRSDPDAFVRAAEEQVAANRIERGL